LTEKDKIMAVKEIEDYINSDKESDL